MMGTTIDWGGISQQFRRVHSRDLDAWLNGYTANKRPPYLQMVPREPLGPVPGPDAVKEVVTAVQLILKDVPKYDRSGMVGRDLTVVLGAGSDKVLAEWEQRHRDTSLEEFNWFPGF